MPRSLPDPNLLLASLSRHYYVACDLGEDEDLDPKDHLEVLRRAFTTSDCCTFASVLHRATGWECRSLYAGGSRVHAFLQAPDGRFVDASGWVTMDDFRRVYGRRIYRVTAARASSLDQDAGIDDVDRDEEYARILQVISVLPWAPFSGTRFKASLRRYMAQSRPASRGPEESLRM